MSCEDIPSLLDLQKVKKHAEDFGRLMGTGTGTSTNGVTGQVRPTFNKVINDMRGDFNQHVSGMAFARVGTFKSGATLDDLREVLLWDVANGGDGHEYGWTGAFQKEVLPNSTPSSTGGIGPGAWVDRTDVTLRSELSAPGGAGLVGFSGGDPDLFAERAVVDVLKSSMRFDDFKGSTDDEKWASMVAYLATPVVTSISVQFSAREHVFLVSPGQLKKPFSLNGMGARSTILKFSECNGISADLSAYGSRYIHSSITCLAVVADSSNKYVGINFKGAQSFAPHDAALILESVSVYGIRDISPTSLLSAEWAVAVNLNDVDEVHMHNVYICGSGLNGGYSTKTTSKAIFANTVTGLRISSSSIYLAGIGIEVIGQSEGAILCGLTIVAVDYGILFRNLVNPANNHVISDTHISAYTKGVELRKHADRSTNPTAVCMSKMFILEREGNASKPQYIAVECYATRSVISDITIQSNRIVTPVRRALVVSNQNNFVSNVHCLNAGATLYIDNVENGYVYYNNIRCAGDSISLLSGSVEFAVGGGLMNSAEPTAYDFRANTFRIYDGLGREQFSSSGSRHMFGGGRHNDNTYLDFRTTSGVTSNYDGRLLFIGGTPGVNGKADAILYAKAALFSGNVAPLTTNTNTVGTAGFTWAGGFTQTAFTVTSDERLKVNIKSLLNSTNEAEMAEFRAMISAWREVDFFTYQFIDRVEKKGQHGARWHLGVIAQRAIASFAKHGLDWTKYTIFNYDKWDAKPAIYGDDGGVIHEAIEAGDKYTINYEEALILESVSQRDRCDSIEARLSALEAR